MALDLADDGPRPRTKTLAEHLGVLVLVPLHRPLAKVARGFYYIARRAPT